MEVQTHLTQERAYDKEIPCFVCYLILQWRK